MEQVDTDFRVFILFHPERRRLENISLTHHDWRMKHYAYRLMYLHLHKRFDDGQWVVKEPSKEISLRNPLFSGKFVLIKTLF